MTTARSCDSRLALARERFSAEFDMYEHAGACFIVTPFLRHDNDPVILRVEETESNGLLVTDGGETIDYLRLSGLTVRGNAAFRKYIERLEKSFGVDVRHEEIFRETSESEFAAALASVARAAQHASYLIYRRRVRSTQRFEDRVEAELIGIGAHYERDVEVPGRTGSRRFHFLVNGLTNALLQPLSGTSQTALTSKAERLIFRIVDVRESRRDTLVPSIHSYRFFPVLDDTGRAADLWDPGVISTLEAYSDGVIRWSSESPRSTLAEALRGAS